MSPAGKPYSIGVLGIPIQSQVVTMATGTISTGLAFAVVATMAAALAHAERGRHGIAARERVSGCRQRRLMAQSGHSTSEASQRCRGPSM